MIPRLTSLFTALTVLVASPLSATEIDIQEVTSPGGIDAWLVEDSTNPFVAIEIWFTGGASLDADGKRGATYLMSGLLEEGAGDKQVVADIKALNGAFLFAMKMQEAARAAGSERFGLRGAGQLDLDAARDEIGIRLACLRAAGGGGELSGGVE